MKALAVPAAAPRSDGLAVAKIAAKNAGVVNVTPTAITTAPVISPVGVCQAVISTSPTAVSTSDEAASGSDGNRSGSWAKTSRHATTTQP